MVVMVAGVVVGTSVTVVVVLVVAVMVDWEEVLPVSRDGAREDLGGADNLRLIGGRGEDRSGRRDRRLLVHGGSGRVCHDGWRMSDILR